MKWPASEGGGSVKNGAALDDAARSILAGSQWGGDLVLPVSACGLLAGRRRSTTSPAELPPRCVAFPAGQVGMISSDIHAIDVIDDVQQRHERHEPPSAFGEYAILLGHRAPLCNRATTV
jgi:hypothetical protein